MKRIIFVHGFGVLKDARGMFTDIVSAFDTNGVKCVLFDLNEKDESGNILLSPFSQQVEKLNRVYEENQSDDTYIIAHSQGCIVTALASLPSIEKTIFLAPPTDNNPNRTIEYFSKNPLTVIDLNGISKLARRDGTFTMVPKEYWAERAELDLDKTFIDYCTKNKVSVVKATQDEIVSNNNFTHLFANADIHEIAGSHDFTNEARDNLINLCLQIISS